MGAFAMLIKHLVDGRRLAVVHPERKFGLDYAVICRIAIPIQYACEVVY